VEAQLEASLKELDTILIVLRRSSGLAGATLDRTAAEEEPVYA